MTKIDVVSGFLGAGKTTLIKKLLADALNGSKTVLIENEFGEIGIDGGFLQESGIEIKEMNSGCICCSLVGDFGTSLKEVISTYAPERILIEPSGVGKLSDVLKAIEKTAGDLDVEINSAVAVVDATKAKMYIKNFGEFFINQIAYAGTIILSRTDKASAEKIAEAVALIREHNSQATIITTPIEELDGKDILATIEGADKIDDLLAEMMEKAKAEPEHHHHHHHEYDENGVCSCGHHHDDDDDDDDEDEHEHHHHHHDDDDDEDEECCHHHHHHDDDDDDEDEHEHHHHHHDDDDDDEECCCHHHHHDDDDDDEDEHEHEHHHHHHHADEVFTSWGMESPKKYTQEKISEILNALDSGEYGQILRAKGMVPAEDGTWIYYDYVPEESDVRSGKPQVTGKICVIGAELKEDKLKELFA
ncbi:MAG: cobalamin biosynthesis protein CobW [Lachnospiraceae bacterium]|nr:cobalamin biosynthesis protein CobW [Lachnospiraceae bacterium]